MKKELKERSVKGIFEEQDEAAFVESMERELEKVASFRNIKGDELTRRIQHSEAVVESMSSSGNGKETGNGNEHKIVHGSGNGLADSPPYDSTRYSNLEGECNRIILELTELSKFVRLNYSGFLKVELSVFQ